VLRSPDQCAVLVGVADLGPQISPTCDGERRLAPRSLQRDVMHAVTDGVGLEGDDAKQAMLDAARWLLTGALAELNPADRHPNPAT